VTELREIVVVGAGLGGLRSVEALRREGFEGRITLVGEEPEAPYDRPPLSKDVLLGTRAPETLFFRTPEKLAKLDVELILDQPAGGLDLAARSIEVGASSLRFDGLILATGATPRTLPDLEGKPGVHTLRTMGDATGLAAAFDTARHVTIVGAGFIGSEVAASARSRGLAVTIVELEAAPLSRALGTSMGAALMQLHAENGTDLRLGVTVDGVGGGGGGGGGTVRLSDGTTIDTDLIVVGVGVVPSIGWLDGSGLELGNGIVCDAGLNAGHPGVFAVGDVANWPNQLFGRRQRVEHWTNTGEQARHAARNLLHGTDTPFLGANFVWSDQYGKRIQFVGSSVADEVVVVDGTTAEGRFLAWYREGERLVGALSIDAAGPLMKSKALIEARTSWTDAQAELASWPAA
jgi:NADPH-dependent 2,4-dienoyl-CoA reductase/sulfur reductase-like enzyme